MNIRAFIIKILKKKGEIRAREVIRATGFSRAYVNRFFQDFVLEGRIMLLGKANAARYVLIGAKNFREIQERVRKVHRIFQNRGLSEDLVLADIKHTAGVFSDLPRNVGAIVEYAFTELMNNAIEHSRSRMIEIFAKRNSSVVLFVIRDRGVGVFRNIMKKRGLRTELEAAQDLLKGKQTTAPREHTGEGIFFTSRAADRLILKSFKKELIFDNALKDVFIKDGSALRGTKALFEISVKSRRQLGDIFREYSGGTFEFSKTAVAVRLYKTDTEYISRSQARRVMSGLDKFKTILLDFKNVRMVGQAFADEVLRVWQARHPHAQIICKNMNENVRFMMERARDKPRP